MLSTLFFYNFAKKSTLKKNHGKSISWRIFKDLAVQTTPLQEGVKPSGQKLTIVEFKATTNAYGDYVPLTDEIDYFSIDPVVTETAELLGEQAAAVIEKLIINKLVTGLNVVYAGGESSTANVQTNTKKISLADINNVKRILKRRNAKPYENGKYIFMIDPEVEMDLKNLTGANASWIDIVKYDKNEKILEGEIGSFLGFKFVVSNNIPTDSTSTSVRKCFAFGKDAYGVVELEGKAGKPSIIHKGLGSAGTNDPLDQEQTLGWKIPAFTTRILHDEALVRYEVYSDASAETEFADSSRSDYHAKNTATE